MNGTGIGNGTDPHPAPHPGAADPTRSVIVVGSGPTGLLLAGDLAAAGVPVTVVEKRPHKISNLSRAIVIHARTLELLDARSLADEVESLGRRLDRMNLFTRLTVEFDSLPSRFKHLVMLPQYETERILERRAVAAGVRFRHETEVTGIDQDEEGVTVRLRGPDGASQELRAAYLVGADGMRSTVRHAVGLPFPGRSVIRSILLADVRLAEPPEETLSVHARGDAFAFFASYGDGYYRIVAWHRHRDIPESEPLHLPEVQEAVRLAAGHDFGMHDAKWLSRFHSDERQAPAYRVGRVFLAGDAAHVHTPAGGQGMNIGLQDAANLSWKLAAVLQGRAADSLLDTYQAERHPVGTEAMRSSGAIVRLAMAKYPWTLGFRAALTATLNVLTPVRRKLALQITGLGVKYRAAQGAHALTGSRVADVELAGGRLYEALRGGRFVLITSQDCADKTGLEDWLTVERRTGRGSGSRTTVLVRPDGYVAWAADDPDLAAVEAAVEAHVGEQVSLAR
ncbi:pentachlorophenol monooxygenase [Streptomyces davaonensis JCM 4913]|uniref:Pentachlorophenol monooxygenase n=1 Tax=Streptomyces davaonensis (strain DSM 101723 / JCM 4913 / KCC S-0913 / 768) TaxID=1214101 RepID=K4R9I3_STRDJ|nr:FAD-dependent monooxygenase [Streptomyces davaonensis]CCK30013.1 pentachlorophenol monooxygenase [Streptomyces davaonensis JCM 4913]